MLPIRLQRIKEMDEEKKHTDMINADRKLRQLAEERGRSVPMRRVTDDREDDNNSRGSSRSGRPNSIGHRARIEKSAPLYSIKGDNQSTDVGSHVLPSVVRKGRDVTAADNQALLRSSSGGGSKIGVGRSKAFLKASGGRKVKDADVHIVNENSEEVALVPMHVRADVKLSNALARKRTPIQTSRDPQAHGSDGDGDLSGDSLDGRDTGKSRADHSDAMSYVSALTNDDGHSYSDLHNAAEGSKKSMIPKPVRKKKKQEVWKMQPIAVKPYIPLPVEL